MLRGRRLVPAAAAALVLATGGCSSGDGSADGSTSASPTPTQTASALEVARAALLTADEIPVPPPSTQVDIPGSYEAQGDQVSAPWAQFMLCSTVAKPDEGPPITVEPDAAAGAWAFGVAYTEPQQGPGYTQIDQYAIVYADEAAAQAAVERARALDCDAAISAWADPDLEWTVETGPVPSPVTGFRTTATFTRGDGSTGDGVSTVMRSGPTVHYLRFSESSGGGRDGLLDADYVEQLLGAVASNLAG